MTNFNPDDHTSVRDSIRERQEAREDELATIEQDYEGIIYRMESEAAELREEQTRLKAENKQLGSDNTAMLDEIHRVERERDDRDAVIAAMAKRLDYVEAAMIERGESEN